MFVRYMQVLLLMMASLFCVTAWGNAFDVERQLLRIDRGAPSSIHDALASKDWEHQQEFGVYGYDDGVYWLHLKVASKQEHALSLVVRMLYPLHDYLDFYTYDGHRLVQHWEMGDARPDPGWVFFDKNFAVPLELGGLEVRDVYIRIQGANTKMLKVEVINYEQMQNSIHWSRLIFGAIYGIMLMMGVYNLIIGVFVKDKAYVLYACQVTFFCFFIMSINGDGRYYLWRDFEVFNQYAIQIFGVIYVFFIILFPWYLLKLNKYLPKARYTFYALGVIELLFALSVMFLPYDVSMQVAVAVSALFSPILLLVGLYLVYKKVPIAGIYTFAWSFYLVGATLVGLAAANVVEMNLFTLNGGAVGGIIEQLLFSVALAKRIDAARKEKFTAMKQASNLEVEALRQKRNFEKIFQRAPVGIATLNLKGEILTINPKCCELFEFDGFDYEKQSDLTFASRFSNEAEIIETMSLTGMIEDYETVITTAKNNHKHCTITLIKQMDAGDAVYEGFITDITERKKTQSIIQAMEEERIASLEQLVTGVAHEINTPLGVGVTSVSFSKDELQDVNQEYQAGTVTKARLERYMISAGDALDLLEENLKKIAILVNRFKQVSFKHVNPEKKRININEYIAIIADEPLCNKPGVNFHLQVDGHETIFVFPDIFDIIIGQLIENSLYHAFGTDQTGNISVYLYITQEKIKLVYQDDGCGVENEIKSTIFDPFVTKNRGAENHSGLGLYRIHNLVTYVLKGQIDLLDTKGFGLSVEFDI